MCNCTSENLEIPGLVLTHHPGMTAVDGNDASSRFRLFGERRKGLAFGGETLE
jgi:hypothetical protein